RDRGELAPRPHPDDRDRRARRDGEARSASCGQAGGCHRDARLASRAAGLIFPSSGQARAPRSRAPVSVRQVRAMMKSHQRDASLGLAKSAFTEDGNRGTKAMHITVTTAPCCWGVDDVANPNLPAWTRVLDEAAAAGYGGLELGPYGYVPLDLPVVTEALTTRGLYIVAGTIFDDLVTGTRRGDLLRQTREICPLITRLPAPSRAPEQRHSAPYLTVMDWGHDERDFAAGHADRAPRLGPGAWAGMMATIRAIATVARDEFGVRAVV